MCEADRAEGTLESVSEVDSEDETADDIDHRAEIVLEDVDGVFEGFGSFRYLISQFELHVTEVNAEESEDDDAGQNHDVMGGEEEHAEPLLRLFFRVILRTAGTPVRPGGGDREDQVEGNHPEEPRLR